MPELPEVETVRRGLARVLEGRLLVRVEQRRPDLRFPLPPRFAARLTGRRVLGLRRRAKYLLIDLDGDEVLIAHLGMSGRLVVSHGVAPPPHRHDHVILHVEGGERVTYNDARRFGMMTLVASGEVDRHPLIAKLAPDPLEPMVDGPFLADRFKGKATPIKAALLDQRVVSGVGNIYACEALFRARLSPRRLAGTVQGVRADRLAHALREVLGQAIAAGGSSLRDYVQADGELGYFQHQWAVYDHEGDPCPGCTCKGTIRRIAQGGRSTFYCPTRQK
ncbi:MAG: bifunctional DNA-formamidopyrimidine glycosylase/DNA-(apurinic or apyrimidinic site) lyase [Alphaproteobacteria bacterium]|nr:bifunctional DNA-formamidopyrimidine glycosylase/DNA-(apurinic or apyrimidinic site) lyase [Alphaproteobacteria bacterium]